MGPRLSNTCHPFLSSLFFSPLLPSRSGGILSFGDLFSSSLGSSSCSLSLSFSFSSYSLSLSLFLSFSLSRFLLSQCEPYCIRVLLSGFLPLSLSLSLSLSLPSFLPDPHEKAEAAAPLSTLFKSAFLRSIHGDEDEAAPVNILPDP